MNHFNSKLLCLEKKNYPNLESSILRNLIAIKAEFEAEGTTIDELAILSQFCRNNKIDLTLKIGGAIAQRDIHEAFQLGAENILAPMIESSFALEYYMRIYDIVFDSFSRLNHNPTLLINVESKLAYENLDEIIHFNEKSQRKITGIVIGRSDLSSSIEEKDVNSDKVFQIALDILKKGKNKNLDVTVGGKITIESFNFLKELSGYGLDAFETRKCTFNLEENMTKANFKKIVEFGLGFELEWLKYKKIIYNERSHFDDERIESIISRL